MFDMTGIFLLVSLFIGTMVDVLSGNAERMLLGIGFKGVFSVVINKPLALYFFVDIWWAIFS